MGQHGEHGRVVRAAALAVAALAPAAARALDCSVALVLALDVSASVDASEYALQMGGLAAAFRDEAVIETILSPEGSGIMASAFMWSGFHHQEVAIDWTWLGDRAAIAAFADALAVAPRGRRDLPTALGRAMAFGAEMLRRAPGDCARKVMDVSGDGVNNDGVEPDWYRSRGWFDGITINGLVIRGATPDPEPYFRAQVLHGPGAFLEVARFYTDYPEAILRKLLRELQPAAAMMTE
ncbi:MAG: DUF1194 domain-containing protein [Rhodobacteraceae bacterium]|nr:MAG: DUF1194 domain-containing protein [Paracoccaceae bacterium]